MNQFKNILYITETSADQASAVARTISLAENNQANLTVMDVIPHVADEYLNDTISSHIQAMESMVEPFRHNLKIPIEFKVQMGPAFIEIIRAVLLNSHDLVIKTVEEVDFLKRLFGSNDMHLLRKCPCPVWLMKPMEKSNYKCIMAAVDFDPLKTIDVEQDLNEKILELASSLAISDFASLHLVHAWEGFPEKTLRARGVSTAEEINAHIANEQMLHQDGLDRLGQTLRDRIDTDTYKYLSPTFHLTRGPAQRRIAEMAVELQADLVVMGTVARTGISGFIIGNTAEAILNQLSCSVLAIKPPGFISPVTLAE